MSKDDNLTQQLSKMYETNIIDIDRNIMRQSLSSITREIQRFQFFNESFPKDNLFEIIKTCKSNLKSRNRKIKILNENIKTACFVAKTLISAKENESVAMKHFIDNVQSECAKIKQDNIKLQNMIADLMKENEKVYNKVHNLYNLIDLCYKVIQNIRNEPTDDVNLFTKFKTIILFCGQYYADYCNENQRCKQLEQKNNFYQHKLKILESNLKNVTNELQNLRYENLRLQRQRKDNNFKKEKECFITHMTQIHNEKLQNSSQKNMLTVSKSKEFDISSHLFLVRNLLADQDIMIRNLNQLSNEVSSFEI